MLLDIAISAPLLGMPKGKWKRPVSLLDADWTPESWFLLDSEE